MIMTSRYAAEDDGKGWCQAGSGHILDLVPLLAAAEGEVNVIGHDGSAISGYLVNKRGQLRTGGTNSLACTSPYWVYAIAVAKTAGFML
jgi:hypothetical protein